jgi:hypothetical protein
LLSIEGGWGRIGSAIFASFFLVSFFVYFLAYFFSGYFLPAAPFFFGSSSTGFSFSIYSAMALAISKSCTSSLSLVF